MPGTTWGVGAAGGAICASGGRSTGCSGGRGFLPRGLPRSLSTLTAPAPGGGGGGLPEEADQFYEIRFRIDVELVLAQVCTLLDSV